ncbi:stabilization of polarity axis-domain-containing protein [Mycena olivaceomarginata]|nr:stabilization of polarity axis-domain-containing protein [Mycena olivaceomarginata]
MHTVFSPLARAVFALVLEPASPALRPPQPSPLVPVELGPCAAARPPLAAAIWSSPFSFACLTRASASQEWSRPRCTICPCDPLTRARVHALLVPFVLALAGNFPASKFPALRLLLALRLGDRLAIIGSANINEQSQLGDRDSELAVVIRSTPTPRAHLLMQPRNPHSAATEYMPRHHASSDLHCGGDYGASDRGRRASEAGNVALRLGVERGEGPPAADKDALGDVCQEVGEYSLITLIKVFPSQALVSGPQHPHLHTNVPQTHPIIILFNGLVTGKHIIFVGYQKPAGKVSSFVLLACALGCVVLHGFIERALPYTNLNNRDEWEACIARPVFIAGVINPIFKSSPTWDLLLNISTGSVTVARDIYSTYPVSAGIPLGLGVPNMVRTATFNTETSLGSEEDIVRSANAKDGAKADFTKADNNAAEEMQDFRKAHLGFDLSHQLFRMQNTKTLSDPEVSAIMRTLAENIKIYGQVIELLAYLMFHGGLLHLAFCLFHQKESVRDATVDLFDQLRAFSVRRSLLTFAGHGARTDIPPRPAQRGDVAWFGLEQEEEIGILLHLPIVWIVSFGWVDVFQRSLDLTLLDGNSVSVSSADAPKLEQVLFLQALNHFQRYDV